MNVLTNDEYDYFCLVHAQIVIPFQWNIPMIYNLPL